MRLNMANILKGKASGQVVPFAHKRPSLRQARGLVCVRSTVQGSGEGSLRQHPDWPASSIQTKYTGLRDEDVLELESFLGVFKQRRAAEGWLQQPEEGPGEVHLVGTGPGDPGLLTLRAVQLMQTADVVLYDRLVSDEILRMVNPSARMVYVGKHSSFHTRSQDEIHELLLAFAEAGACVIRLKGGDPYVFGRGGEEVQYLAARGITVHAVPGITAASGICAELGIPMTHRGVATSVRFLTGHARDGGEQELLDSTIAGAADPHTTLVVYMGLQTLPSLVERLSGAGMPLRLPAVAVERGTTRRQRVVWGTAGELPQLATAAGLKSPALIIMGEVVALAPGYAEWQASGRPLVWGKGRAPAHGYSVPTLDAGLLNAASAAAAAGNTKGIEARPVPTGQPQAAGTGSVSTRDVRTAAAGTSLRRSPLNAVLSTRLSAAASAAVSSPLTSLALASGMAAPSKAAYSAACGVVGTRVASVTGPTKNNSSSNTGPSAASNKDSGGATSATTSSGAAGVHARTSISQAAAASDDGVIECGMGEDDACPLPMFAAKAPAAAPAPPATSSSRPLLQQQPPQSSTTQQSTASPEKAGATASTGPAASAWADDGSLACGMGEDDACPIPPPRPRSRS